MAPHSSHVPWNDISGIAKPEPTMHGPLDRFFLSWRAG